MNLFAVLVRTEYAANIGSAARALANMGGRRLILINRLCEVGESAHQMAAGAQDMLNSRTEYPDWKSFFAAEGEGLRIGLTRRGGRKRKTFDLDEKLRELKGRPETQGNVYLIFGNEASGLDHEDLAYVNFSCHLPEYGEFSSLNLAQAVLLAGYIARSCLEPDGKLPVEDSAKLLAVQPMYFPDELIKEWLEAMGFDVDARRASAYITLRRLFLHQLPTQHELQVLEAILQQNIRKLRAVKTEGPKA
jgi:TrmH family RNA methyltransferase